MRTPHYYYKRPGDWLWHPHETSSLAKDVHSGKISADWKYRVAGEADEYSLAELLEAEHAHRIRPRTPAEEQMLAPDGTWGFIVVAACSLLLLFVMFFPSREGAIGSGKFYLVRHCSHLDELGDSSDSGEQSMESSTPSKA